MIIYKLKVWNRLETLPAKTTEQRDEAWEKQLSGKVG